MLAHREQSFCHIESNLFCGSMTKIRNTMTKSFMVSLVCLCVFDGNEDENWKHLFIGVYGRCGPQKLCVKCGPHKRILC